jgi:ATP-dependent Clp protease, protease subunit
VRFVRVFFGGGGGGGGSSGRSRGRISPERISPGRLCRGQHALVPAYGECHRGDMTEDHTTRTAVDDDLERSLLEQRTLVMSGVLDEATGNRLSTGLLVLSARDPGADIHVWINSPGGSVPSMLAIRDVMKLIPNDVSTLAMGIACSAGQFLLSAGTPGKRFALPHARVLLHQGSAGIGGTAMDIAIQADDLRHTRDTVLSLISQDTGQDVETVERDSRRDRWFSAEEARDYGFVDAVVSSIEQVQSLVRRPLGLGVGTA